MAQASARDWTRRPFARRPGSFPLPAYSEFMPPPWLGPKPYGTMGPAVLDPDDPHGWLVAEYEEEFELRPGLAHIAERLVTALVHLGKGRPLHGISQGKLADNPYWPAELAAAAGSLPHERYVLLLPLALSRTQDDKGRVRWTLFGGSEYGPERAFWRSFEAPGLEPPGERATRFLRRLLTQIYRESARERVEDMGLAIFPTREFPAAKLPQWTRPLLLGRKPPASIRYLLTFRPYSELPPAVRALYLAGKLHLLPFPGSLFPWGAVGYQKLANELPAALQIPLLHLLERFEAIRGIRIPQSGYLHEPHPDHPEPHPEKLPLRNHYRRTHRWARLHRDEDELAVADGEDRMAHVLFSNRPEDIGLYGKPMARNAQLWTMDYRLLLDGPSADAKALRRAAETVRAGGQFGYRFQWPPMRVGRHEVLWHRPLVAYAHRDGRAQLLDDAPLGFLAATVPARRADGPIELWPRLLRRPLWLSAIDDFPSGPFGHRTMRNIKKLLDARERLQSATLPRDFARALLTLPSEERIEDWLASLEDQAADRTKGRQMAAAIAKFLAPADEPARTDSLTFSRTMTRGFETRYWNTIRSLAHGQYLTKSNADCVLDPPSVALSPHPERDLDALGDHLLAYYRREIAKAKMQRRADAGELPFTWETDFDFPWMGGWRDNQQGRRHERNLLVRIPGRDRSRAVILADHYDTAYMEDRYERARGGNGARLAAAGADDNHSATATLMLAAPIYLALAQRDRLACDIWLVHLTGEEFPADCMGARRLARWLVERDLRSRGQNGRFRDLSQVAIAGVYVLDMVAHNNDHHRDVLQLAPGITAESLELARVAREACQSWNVAAAVANDRAPRKGLGRGQRATDGWTIPAMAKHLVLSGEVRPPADPRSSLFNTDGQIFSDVGVPVVLFMENYDINRVGYHDTHDTMENIDLDYGSAVAAIAIETAARLAAEREE